MLKIELHTMHLEKKTNGCYLNDYNEMVMETPMSPSSKGNFLELKYNSLFSYKFSFGNYSRSSGNVVFVYGASCHVANT